MRQRKKNKIIILSLIGLLCIMAAGYAAFQTNLKIKGTSNISSKWDILITNVEEINKSGEAQTTKKEGATNPNWNGLTANIEADITQKGDFIEYEVTVENRGTLDAKLNNIKTNTAKENEAILISFLGYIKGQKLEKGATHKIIVRIEYNPDFEGIPELGRKETNIELEYSQNDSYKKEENGEITSPNRYLITYDYNTNGGNNTTGRQYYASETEAVDLNPSATKEGYEFVGWNTNKDAKEGLKELPMPSEDTTLYAIFRKTLTINYTKQIEISSIEKERDTCYLYNNENTCEITLPQIMVKGYTILGWYNGETKVGNQNEKYNINSNVTLNAKAIDDIKPTTPVITNSSNGLWTSNDVTVTITSSDEGSGIDYYEWYENGEWIKTSLTTTNGLGTIVFTVNRNQTVRFRAVDKAGNISEEASTVIKIDKGSPTLSVATNKTTESITVVATASAYSEISKYEYSKDGGSTWTTGTSNTYTFSGLTNNTAYSIRVRVTSGVSKQTTSTAISVTTNNIAVPTYKQTSTTSGKSVTLTYPTGCGSTYTCTYIKNSGTPVTVTSTTATVNFTESGNVVGKVSDGTNTVSSSYSVAYSFTNSQATNTTDCTATSSFTCNHSNVGKNYVSCTGTGKYQVITTANSGIAIQLQAPLYSGKTYTFDSSTGKFKLGGTIASGAAVTAVGSTTIKGAYGSYAIESDAIVLINEVVRENTSYVVVTGTKYTSKQIMSKITHTCN